MTAIPLTAQPRPHETAAAEMIGALTLVAILVVAIAIVAVVLFSQPGPDTVPALAITISNESKVIEIEHDSGETLPFEEMEILVDDNVVRQGTAAGEWTCTNCGSDLSVGDSITIDYSSVPGYSSTTPNKVDIIYVKAGEQHRLLTTRYLGTMTPTPTATGTPGTTQTIVTTTIPPATAPVASFYGTPTTGTEPLSVAFTDTSTNTPVSWLWDFGDGSTSTEQNPSHSYAVSGSYYVNLTAWNTAGSDSENKTAYVVVSPAPVLDIFLNANKPSSLVSGGYFEFRLAGSSWPSLVHNGVTYSPNNGDVVRLILGSDTKGQIYATPSQISSFSFDDVQLIINGNSKGSGTLSSIWVNGYDSVESTLALDTPSNPAWTRFEVDHVPMVNPMVFNSSRIQVYNLKLSEGMMNLDNRVTTYYDGGATSYLITPATAMPVANFTGAPASGARPLTVQFTDTSTNSPTIWLWSFGDSNTTGNNLRNPSHLYQNAGTYTVSLTATNGAGSGSVTKTGYIVVNTVAPPVAGFSGLPTSGNQPLVVQFTDSSTNTPTSWLWDFGDGNTTGNNLRNPSHKYTAAGTYTVNLTAINAGGSNSLVRTGYITVNAIPRPVAGFTGTPVSGNQPLVVQFTDSSTNTPTSWLWDFGDGNTTGNNLQNPSHKYTAVGTYPVSLTASNGGGSNTSVKTGYITVTPPLPYAAFTGTPVTGTVPLTVSFTATANNTPTSWSWNFGDGGTSTLQNPSHQYTAGGTYTVSLTVANAGGSTTTTRTNYIVVNAIRPVAGFTGTPTSGTIPLTVQFTDSSTNYPTSWSWTFGDGGTATTQSPSHQYAAAGTYTVSLTASNAAGSNTLTRTSYITATTPLTADFSYSVSWFLLWPYVTFTDTSTGSPVTWSWTFGDGGTSTQENPGHWYPFLGGSGSYPVTLSITDTAGKTATVTKTITL